LSTVDGGTFEREAPPPPSWQRLPDGDVPKFDRAQLRRRAEEDAERRAALGALVQANGWTWDAVIGARDQDPRSEANAEPSEVETEASARA